MTGDLPVPRALAPDRDSLTPEQRPFRPDMHPNEGLTCGFVCRDAPVASMMIHIHIMFLPVWLIRSVLACVPVSFLEGA